MSLDPKHLKAVNLYLKGYTKKEALLSAGYKHTVASTDQNLVFGRDDVKKEIEKRKRAMVERNGVTEDWIVQRLFKIAQADPGDMIEWDDKGRPFINWNKLSPAIRSGIAAFQEDVYTEGRGKNALKVKRVKIKERDVLRALELLGKYLGMWREKVEVSTDADLINRLQAGRQRVAKQEEEDSDESTSHSNS